jgi:hypothetical protein
MKICPSCRHALHRGFLVYWLCPTCERIWEESTNEELVENTCPVPECEHLEMI